MEILDEYQDSMGQAVAGDVAVANMASIAAGMAHHRHTPDSPMSHQEEDLSDPDRQDEESGEELPQQPLQGTNRSSADSTPVPTPLTHLNSLMSSTHPHFLAKIKLENDMDILNNKSGLEALQAAMSGGGFNLPFSFPAPGAFLAPGQQQQHPQHPGNPLLGQSGSSNGAGPGSNNNNGGGSAHASSASSHSSESSQGSGRNGLEVTANRESAGSGGGGGVGGGGGGGGGGGCGTGVGVHTQPGSQGQQSAHQQQTSWSFEEQFKQVRQASTLCII
ncbi:PREDICTED: protein dead ringer-like [Ceratosolen solmsi marchali]|uniref:Protein dead ringer-like n=1 Tax=Ceratosolen solmsi marchali TaxID=326594 RepID=A0AAJ6VIV6_9HYME|nr:PREDICTED: protein dead ringer-like [Ceratosolen solmsi marchali]